MKASRYSEVQQFAQIRSWKFWVWELPNPDIWRVRQNSSEERPGRSKGGLDSSWPEVKVTTMVIQTMVKPHGTRHTKTGKDQIKDHVKRIKNKVFFHVECPGLRSRKWFLAMARMTLDTNRVGHRVSGNKAINTHLKKKKGGTYLRDTGSIWKVYVTRPVISRFLKNFVYTSKADWLISDGFQISKPNTMEIVYIFLQNIKMVTSVYWQSLGGTSSCKL